MDEEHDITVPGVLRQSLKFNMVHLLSKFMLFITGIVIARVLLPEEYGVIGLVGLWLTYANLIHPGIDSAAQREMPYLLGKGEKEKALHLQNVAITGKILYSLLPSLVIFFSSFLYTNELIRLGLIITALSYFISTNTVYWFDFNRARQRFNKVAVGELIRGITTPLVTISLILWLRVYAVLIAPIVGVVLSFFYLNRNAGIDYSFRLDWKETVRLIKIGFPLALLTIAYWGYRMADRTMIAAFLPLDELGLYSYAIGMVSFAVLLFADFSGVLQPVLWTNLGKAKNHIEGFKPLRRIAVYMAIIAAICIGVCQIGFYLLVHLVTTKYVGSIPVFNVLAFGIFLMSMMPVPNLILTSSTVNKQIVSTKIWLSGLALNIILDYIVIKAGYGIVGVSLVTIAIQCLVLSALFLAVRRYLFLEKGEFTRFMKRILLPLLISALLYMLNISLKSRIQDILSYSLYSLICFGIVWFIAIRIFYRDYFQKEKFIQIWGEVIEFIKVKRQNG